MEIEQDFTKIWKRQSNQPSQSLADDLNLNPGQLASKFVRCFSYMLALEEIDGIVLNKTINKRKNLAFVLVLDKTSRFGLAD